MDDSCSIISELQLHINRLSNSITLDLEKCIIDNQWETMDYTLIVEELEGFINSRSPSEETYNEL